MRKIPRSRRSRYAGIIAQYEREKKAQEPLRAQTADYEAARAIIKGG